MTNLRLDKAPKYADVITLPAAFFEELNDNLYAAGKAKLFRTFNKLGLDLVTLMEMAAPDVGQLALLANQFAQVIPTKKISIKTEGNFILVDIIGAGRRIETTECSFEFVKAILLGYGYRIASQDIGVGIIRIRGTKAGA